MLAKFKQIFFYQVKIWIFHFHFLNRNDEAG